MSDPLDRYAVFGNPVAHSLSPRIHGLFAQQCAQAMRYEAILAPTDDFGGSVAAFVAAGGKGANVTVPFKQAAFALAGQLSARAQAAGAVNTLSFTAGSIHGDNTDGVGLVADLRNNLGRKLAGGRLLLLGAGGAARGVIQPLLEAGVREIFIANRSAAKAQQLAADFQLQGGGFDALANRQFDLLINATAAGLADAELPLPDTLFTPDCLAYEMLYRRQTAFMQQAAAAGAEVADGLGMLVEQAAEAFFIWRCVRPDAVRVLRTLRG